MPQRENHKSWSLDKFTVAAGGSHSPFTFTTANLSASKRAGYAFYLGSSSCENARNRILALSFTLEAAGHMQPEG